MLAWPLEAGACGRPPPDCSPRPPPLAAAAEARVQGGGERVQDAVDAARQGRRRVEPLSWPAAPRAACPLARLLHMSSDRAPALPAPSRLLRGPGECMLVPSAAADCCTSPPLLPCCSLLVAALLLSAFCKPGNQSGAPSRVGRRQSCGQCTVMRRSARAGATQTSPRIACDQAVPWVCGCPTGEAAPRAAKQEEASS